MRKLMIVTLCVVLGGCSTSVVDTGSPSPPTTTSSTRPLTSLEAHLATEFTSMFSQNGGDFDIAAPGGLGRCMARETVAREGGAAALAALGITAESTNTEIGSWLDSMLTARVTGKDPEPFDAYVDAMWACGFDELFATEFRAQLHANGNADEKADCLVTKVVDDRYLRLVLIVGTRTGSTPDPETEKNFGEPLVAAVDEAARACGGVVWGGS